MGLVYIMAKIANPAVSKKVSKQKFLVDSGALYSVVPEKVLKRLEIKPESKMAFTLANGETVQREGGTLCSYIKAEEGHPQSSLGNLGIARF